jgi:hypothetical protein
MDILKVAIPSHVCKVHEKVKMRPIEDRTSKKAESLKQEKKSNYLSYVTG